MSNSPHAASSRNEVDAGVARFELMVRLSCMLAQTYGYDPPRIKKTREEDLLRANTPTVKRIQ
jgi:hypothetical protein